MIREKVLWAIGLSILLLSGPFPGQAQALPASDFDNDCDVDPDDFGFFQLCTTGPGIGPPAPECEPADLDFDLDVDQSDFGIFQRCYSGEGNPADPNCDLPCSGPECDCLCGQTNCGGTCTSTTTDEAHCGACGNVCDEGLTCANGSCEACANGGTLCSGVCTNIAFDTLNCGGCGIVCAGGETCSGGICQSPW